MIARHTPRHIRCTAPQSARTACLSRKLDRIRAFYRFQSCRDYDDAVTFLTVIAHEEELGQGLNLDCD